TLHIGKIYSCDNSEIEIQATEMGFQKVRAAWRRFKNCFMKKKDAVAITASVETSTDVTLPADVDYETSKKDDQKPKEEAEGITRLQVEYMQVKLQEEIQVLDSELKIPFQDDGNTWNDDGDSLSIVSLSDTTSITRFSTSPRSQCSSSSLTLVTELSQSVSGFFSPCEIRAARSSLSDCIIEFPNDGSERNHGISVE
ncbi:unnamed protein product, partial [Owenia fusiformis]